MNQNVNYNNIYNFIDFTYEYSYINLLKINIFKFQNLCYGSVLFFFLT